MAIGGTFPIHESHRAAQANQDAQNDTAAAQLAQENSVLFACAAQ